MSQIPLGRFVSFDYVAPEPRKAQAFYGALFGWTSQHYATPLAMKDAPQQAHWLPLLQTPSAHDSAAKAKILGGANRSAMDMPPRAAARTSCIRIVGPIEARS